MSQDGLWSVLVAYFEVIYVYLIFIVKTFLTYIVMPNDHYMRNKKLHSRL